MSKNLVIVESPAKAKTIQGYLGNAYEVVSSYGHIRDLPKNNHAIDINKNFQPTYEITKGKQQLIKALKQKAKVAEKVYLASDDDREGEAISWHLKEALGLQNEKIARIVFREITKKTLLEAIAHPRNIDIDLVNSQQARRILDRLVGFDLSPLLWKKVKPGLSAGRVQSVAVRMVVERERAINSFIKTSYFVVTAKFEIDKKTQLEATLSERFSNEEAAYAFLESCINASFNIEKLEKKLSKRSPSPPFTTSTLQQEASQKLGYSVSKTMLLAQQLYESGHISYMRTDSVRLSEEAINHANKEIENSYGPNYFQARQYKTKSATAQEAHEAIRPTDFSKRQVSQDNSAQRLYELIWKRALASQMADAKIEKTTAYIKISTAQAHFLAQGEVLKFDGFLKAYALYSDNDDQEEKSANKLLPPLSIGQMLPLITMQAREKFTKPPARYSEASLVQELEEKGIGRPSTYAPTISTIQQRGYVVKESREGVERNYITMTLTDKTIKKTSAKEIVGTEKNKLFPTDMAMVVNDFLVGHFSEITDYGFTAKIENQLDEIATGNKAWVAMLSNFYNHFHPKVEETQQVEREKLSISRQLGTDPTTGKSVIARLGRYGPLVQIGTQEDEEPPRFAAIGKDQRIDSITLEEALTLFKFPRSVGHWHDSPIISNIGRFGPYLKYQDKFFSLPKEEDPLTITELRAIEVIMAKQKADAEKIIKTFEEDNEVKILNGRFGPYLQVGKKNIKIPKEVDPHTLDFAACQVYIQQATANDVSVDKGKNVKKKSKQKS